MKRTSLSKIVVLLMTLCLMAACFSGCRMNLPDTSKIGPDAQADAKEDSEEAAEGSADGDMEDVFSEVLENDVTAGTVEDGYYSISAAVNKDVTLYVDAPEVVLKDKSPKKGVDIKDKAGDLNKARMAYLTNYYEGDEESAKEDLADYEKAEPTDAQMAAMKEIYGELGKVFAQFDIANYDMSAPTEADETYVTYDVYSSANEPFSLEFEFDEDSLVTITISYDGELE